MPQKKEIGRGTVDISAFKKRDFKEALEAVARAAGASSSAAGVHGVYLLVLHSADGAKHVLYVGQGLLLGRAAEHARCSTDPSKYAEGGGGAKYYAMKEAHDGGGITRIEML